MRLYQIADLERHTGIKAHTIRIWEKRYNLIEPDRTSTNYRRYNDAQLRKLLNVSTLLKAGYKISQIAALNEKELFKKITENQSGLNHTIITTTFINDLLTAILSYNESAFEKSYASVVTRLGIFDAMITVFYPLLQKIGMMWTINDVDPAQEHFASCLLKRKIMAATDGLPMCKKRKKKFLLVLIPGEFHDISLLFANYIIKSKGYETVFLGQDVPYENIALALKQTRCNYVLTFFTVAEDPRKVYNELKKHSILTKNVTFLASGNPSITEHLKLKLSAEVLKKPDDLFLFL